MAIAYTLNVKFTEGIYIEKIIKQNIWPEDTFIFHVEVNWYMHMVQWCPYEIKMKKIISQQPPNKQK